MATAGRVSHSFHRWNEWDTKSVRVPNGDIDPLHQIITAARRMDTLMHEIRSYLSTARPATATLPLIDTNHTLAQVIERLHSSIMSSGAVITNDDLPHYPDA